MKALTYFLVFALGGWFGMVSMAILIAASKPTPSPGNKLPLEEGVLGN